MKKLILLLTGILSFSVVFTGCGDDDEDEVIIMGEIHATVMFMSYVIQNDAANMIMVYAWDAADWFEGPNGAIASEAVDGMLMMAAVTSSSPDTLMLTDEAEMDGLPAGSYYVGVFESTQMAYGFSTTTLIGYYNAGNTTTYITMMGSEATAITISTTTPVELKTMMAMPMGGL